MYEVVVLIIVPELTRLEFDTLFPLVSLEQQERIKRYRFFQDARNTLLGNIIIRTEICRSTGLSNKQLTFSTNDFGKPFLVSNPNIHYNISHAGHYVACVVAEEPVGIDIELIKPIDMKIAERFFTSDETAYIYSNQQIHRFYEVWTKKESRIKWEGKGLYKPLPSFSVIDQNQQEETIAYHKVFHDDETICHICSTNWKIPSVRIIDTAMLLSQARYLL